MKNVRETSCAGSTFAFPAWEAVTVHEPAPVIEMVAPFEPDAEQSPEAAKLTGRAELELALRLRSPSPYVRLVGCAKLITWPSGLITSVPVTAPWKLPFVMV